MKKAMIIVFVFAIALTANMALANNDCGRCDHDWDHDKDACPCPSINVDNKNTSTVTNMVTGMSNSGMNMAKGGDITTGASTTGSWIKNYVGMNETYVNPTSDKMSVKVINANTGTLINTVFGSSNTGMNYAGGGMMVQTFSRCHKPAPTEAGNIVTGAAYTGSDIYNVVGSNVTKIGCTDCGMTD